MALRAVTACFLGVSVLPALAGVKPDAGPHELLRAVPADAWAAIILRPRQQAADPGDQGQIQGRALDAAAFVFDQVRRMGLVAESDRTTAALMDAVGSLPVVARSAKGGWALCLLGGRALGLPSGGHRLADLRAALIVHTNKDNADLEARIQHLLKANTNSGVAVVEPIQRGPAISHRLIDKRLPGWAVIEWGPAGDCYVVALGAGAFDAIAATINGDGPSLARDRWFASAHRRCRGGDASTEWTVRFDEIRAHLQPVMAGKPDEVLRGLGLADVDRGLWTLGSRGRAVEAYSVLRRVGTDEFVPICAPSEGPTTHPAIPPQASRYAVIDHNPGDLVRRARDAYLAGRSSSTQQRLRSMWAQLEAEADVDVDRDLLSQLGPSVVIHDYPRHSLGIPFARTIVVPVTGSPVAVRTAVDRLLRRYQRHLERPGADWPLLRLHQADDGVWYVQAGLYGPALAVTDRWLVVSYSPVAVRQNLAYLETADSTTPAPSAGGQGGP